MGHVAKTLKYIQVFDRHDRLRKHRLRRDVEPLLRTATLWAIKRKIGWTLALDLILVAL